jgi:hypothetical protein
MRTYTIKGFGKIKSSEFDIDLLIFLVIQHGKMEVCDTMGNELVYTDLEVSTNYEQFNWVYGTIEYNTCNLQSFIDSLKNVLTNNILIKEVTK